MSRTDYEAIEDVKEWEKLLDELKEDEAKYLALKKYIENREQEIINTADFNKLYNKNNDKIRKYHVKKELANTVQQKEDLKLKIDANKRQIEFLKSLVAVKVELMRLEE